MWVAQYGWEQLRIHCVPENGDEGEEQEQDDIENEHDL